MNIAPEDENNLRLISHVHPPTWENPRATADKYNLVVIGGGTAGLVAAAGGAVLGGKVALIEKHFMGGDCLVTGCVPSKSLLAAAKAAAAVKKAAELGIKAADSHVDFAEVMRILRATRADVAPHDAAARFRDLGADIFFGEARFSSPTSIAVGGQTLNFARAVIATGSRPSTPPVEGLEECGFLTNETVFSLTALPPRLAIIGGGPIGCEMAQAFRRLGAEVTLLSHGPRLLGKEEPDASRALEDVFAKEGITLHLGVKIKRAEKAGLDKRLVFEAGAGETATIAIDEILVAAGRKPNVQGLGLDAAGVRVDNQGSLCVDDRLRTSNRRIYAAGDVVGGYQFTHAADAMARLVLRNALFFGSGRSSKLIVPWCTYTDPEIARVGMSEEQARRSGIAFQSVRVDLDESDRAIVEHERPAFARLHVASNGRILGATIVAAAAGELIAPVALAMTTKQKLKAFSEVIFPYPTRSEMLKRAADAHARRRLKPPLTTLLKTFLRWRR